MVSQAVSAYMRGGGNRRVEGVTEWTFQGETGSWGLCEEWSWCTCERTGMQNKGDWGKEYGKNGGV